MRQSLLLIAAILFLLSNTGNSQIKLVGAVTNPDSQGISIVTWDALDAGTLETYATGLAGYYLSSSVFDAYNSNYYLAGLTESSQGLFSFNTKSYEQGLAGYTNFSNITEIDMSTGKIYNLVMESADYINVNEYDIETGQDSLLGVIHEPGTGGIIVDAIAFNSNDGILYYLGYDSVPNLCLYSIPVRDDEFSFSKVILETDNAFGNTFFSLNYDNVNNLIFALNLVFDLQGNFAGTNLAAISPLTGEVTIRSQLDEFSGFVAGSAAFDQLTGSYLVIAIDTNNSWKHLVYDTHTDTYVTGWAPAGASEIVCDNSTFATVTYITADVNENSQAPQVVYYPNPAETVLTVTVEKGGPGNTEIGIFDLTGKQVASRMLSQNRQVNLDVSGLKPGLYLLRIKKDSFAESHKLIIR